MRLRWSYEPTQPQTRALFSEYQSGEAKRLRVWRLCDGLESGVQAHKSEREAWAGVAKLVMDHLNELRDAWQRGSLSEHDGKGGTRSNRNVDAIVKLRAVLERYAP